jgi:hypothetical protein
MHVPTHNFGSVGENIDEIQKRVIDALFHVRDADGPSEFLVSIFLPEAQCHLLVSIDPETDHRCRLQVLSQTVEGARVVDQFTAKEYEQAVRYVRHILLEFDRQRTVSNLVITTDGRRVRDVSSLVDQHETASTGE